MKRENLGRKKKVKKSGFYRLFGRRETLGKMKRKK